MILQITRRAAGVECAEILAELPEWFGIPASNAAYAERAAGDDAFVAEAGGEVLGVMVLEATGFSAIDIHVLAVRPTAHRRGIGAALVAKAHEIAAERGARYVTVKTRGPSAPYEPYDRTRAFAVGFEGLEEFVEIWGPENPCLIMIAPTRVPSTR